ncbi:MAG: hypothetical protein LBV79_11565, partial [Candidatus Adiutrix sp.]|nr:hypothetical protein [Candidatus Adiutrix sp.]
MAENAQQLLQERSARFNTAVKLGQPDRVPFAPNIGGMPFEWFGVTYAEAFRDPSRAAYAWLEFLKAYPGIDARAGFWAAIPFSAKTKQLLGYKLINFPGVDIEDENVGFQFVEEEYMKANEYDAFLHNPGDFGLRKLLPQFAEAFKPLAMLPNLDGTARGYGTVGEWCIAFTKDEVWKSLEAFREAGKEHLKTVGVIRKFNEEALALGFPGMIQGTVTAPFDVVSDLLRGTVGTMK